MPIKTGRYLLWSMAVTVALILSLNCSVFAEAKSISAEKMWNMAEAKANSMDLGAMIEKASYSRGNRDLKFERGEFIFYAPNHPKAPNFSIKIGNGEIIRVREVKYGNLDSTGIGPMPYKSVNTALDNGLDEWWSKYPRARLYLTLIPRKYYSSAPGTKGDWIWKIMGSGPGVPEDIYLFVNAENFEFLGKKIKPLSKNQQNITEEEVKNQINKILEGAGARKNK